MRDTFRYLIDNYGERAGTKLDPQDGLHSLMTSKAVDQLIKLAKISTSDYIVEGSVGKGLYAYVPWLAVRSRDESVAKSITQGYYVVYLFRADMSGFYLSLMQGWNYFYTKHNERVAPARAEIQSISDHWRRELSSDISQFNVARIDLPAITERRADTKRATSVANSIPLLIFRLTRLWQQICRLS